MSKAYFNEAEQNEILAKLEELPYEIYSVHDTAEIVNRNRSTLHSWHVKGKFKAREKITPERFYYKQDIIKMVTTLVKE